MNRALRRAEAREKQRAPAPIHRLVPIAKSMLGVNVQTTGAQVAVSCVCRGWSAICPSGKEQEAFAAHVEAS